MAKISGKPKLPISNSDLKKAIVERNNSLEHNNKNLSSKIKEKEKELKSLDKECKSVSKEISNLYKDIQFQEERLQKINGGVYSADQLLKTKLNSISKSEKELKGNEKSLTEAQEKESKLKEDIKGLELYKVKCSESKGEIKSLKKDKEELLKSIDNLKHKEKILSNGYSNKVIAYEIKYEELEKDAKSHEDMVCRFEQRLFDAKDQSLKEEKKLEDIKVKSEDDIQKAKDELQAINNLIENTEDKYIEWEQKVAREKAKADREQERNAKAKDNFAKWKIGVLEEVARLKLKSKVDKIDKAGLSDILNG